MRRILAALLLVGFLWSGPAAAGRVRLVVMDGINLQHLSDGSLTNFQILLEQGAVGLANANTAGGRTLENTAITLGSGSRALGPEARKVFHSRDSLESSLAGEVHARRTGVVPPPDALVMPNIAWIQEANSELLYTVRVGYLASALNAGGRTMAALANADGEDIHRSAAAILADNTGIIPGGRVGLELVSGQQWLPFGLQSNLPVFFEALTEFAAVDLLVLDLGDTARVQEYRALAVTGRQEVFRTQALAQLDRLLGELLEQHRQGDLLLVTGLQADRILGEEEGKWLVPVLVYGHNFSPGLLTSPTTRRHGVVANYDITATILEFFDLYMPGEIHGQPMTTVKHADPVGYLLNREKEMSGIYQLRAPFIKGYIAVIIILVALSLAALFLKWRNLKLFRLSLATVLASPLALLVLGFIPGSFWMVPLWIALVLAIALLGQKAPPHLAMTVLGAATALAVGLDALLGAWLQQRSILGYDAIAGARYYGIGNEYMGVLLGSTLLAVSPLLARRKGLASLVFAAVILLLMLPGVGANFGGTLAAVLGFVFSLAGVSILKAKKHRLIAVLSILLAIAALVLVNLKGGSHIGRFFAAVLSQPKEFWLAVQRKLAMGWRLVRWSLWSRVFAALWAAALCLLYANRRTLAQKMGCYWPWVRGTMAAAAAALILNDSGIVAAATTLLYLTLPLLYYEFSSSSLVRDSHSE